MHRSPIVTGAFALALLCAMPACLLEQEDEGAGERSALVQNAMEESAGDESAWEESTGPGPDQLESSDPRALELAREALGPIPLTGIVVRAHVAGSLAEVMVEQTFENLLEERIEAVYVFPLPDDAAVYEMVMIVGERRVRADLRERTQARQAYDQARAAGQTASLLEQERPNVFTMSVANIQPGLPVRVLVRYVEELPYRDGRYRFHFPTTVGPRFVPGEPVGHEGTGALADTNRVSDASRITPAVLPEGVPTPYEVDFSLELEAGMDVVGPRSTSHDLEIQHAGSRHLSFSLRPEDRQPDRDIELSYALAADEPGIGMLTHYDPERGGYFSLMFEPPASFDDDDVRPKEMVFVLDTSGSMWGYPIETAKETVRNALRNMNPDDTFQIIGFDDAASSLSPTPLTNTPGNVARGLAFVDAMNGGGGTMMNAGIHAALGPPPDEERMRIVLFLTDGYIGNETEILAQIDREVGRSRLFSLGVGSSVNRFLLDRMAKRGRGAVQYVNVDQEPGPVVETFYGRIRNPILTDVTVDFHGFQVEGLVPDQELIPDVFAGTPVLLTGRYCHGGRTRATISGWLGTRPVSYELDMTFPDEDADRPAIAHLWARRQIEAIESRHSYADDTTRDEVLALALEYGLLTQYTAFVAIEETINPDAGDPLRTEAVPVALPYGTSGELMGPQVQQDLRPASPFGADTALGVDPANALGLLVGAQIGDSFGYGGLGLSGTGRAGGGDGLGTIGLGNMGTIGHGGGGGSGSGYGRGAGGLRGHRASESSMRTGPAEVYGALAPEVIGRYIRRYINQIRFCYEQQLARRPDLVGRIVIRFVISPTGAVTSASVTSSTMGDPTVEQCVAQTIQRITFPRPEGGGVVIVTYPFMFQPEP